MAQFLSGLLSYKRARPRVLKAQASNTALQIYSPQRHLYRRFMTKSRSVIHCEKLSLPAAHCNKLARLLRLTEFASCIVSIIVIHLLSN
jgi:hypothetical protein